MILSIIVPVYKVEERLLSRCIKSILSQTFTDFELILVDDGSPDNYRKYYKKYMHIDDRVKFIHKENGGVSSARNIGIKVSKGEYISFIDADDWIDDDFYKLMIDYAEKYNLDLVVSGYVKNINNKDIKVLKKTESKIFNSTEGLQKLIDRKIYEWSPCDKIYKSKVIKNKIFFDEKISMGEDLDFLWKVFKSCNKIGYIPLHKYHYYFRADSATNINSPEKKCSSVKVMRDILDEAENMDKELYKRMKELYVKELASCCRNLLIYSDDKRKYEKLIRKYQKEIRNNLMFGIKGKSFSFKIKLGIIYFVFPFYFCKLFNNILK